MWRLLSVLTLCGMPALWADVCGGLPTGFPKWAPMTDPKDDLHPVSFQLSVKQGGPAFRITVRSLWNSIGWPARFTQAILRWHAARTESGYSCYRSLADQPLNFGASFHAEDINFDGYLDFSVLTEFAARWGSRSYWVYDPASGLFVQNELTRELSENCLAAVAWRLLGRISHRLRSKEARGQHAPLLALAIRAVEQEQIVTASRIIA